MAYVFELFQLFSKSKQKSPPTQKIVKPKIDHFLNFFKQFLGNLVDVNIRRVEQIYY